MHWLPIRESDLIIAIHVKKIKKKAEEDKLAYKKKTFETWTTQREKWVGIKYAKKAYTPKFTMLKYIRGERVPYGKHAEAIAEYLEKVQWTNSPDIHDKINPKKLIEEDLQIDIEEITLGN